MTIDFSKLAIPTFFDVPAFATLVSEYQAIVRKAVPSWTPQASDQIQMMIEAFAYREIALRNKFNDQFKFQFLPWATGLTLDALATSYNLTRLAGEKDDAFRIRINKSLDGYSTTGTKESYEYHALSVDSTITQAYAFSPSGGQSTVVITTADNVVSSTLLSSVSTKLNSDKLKPVGMSAAVSVVKATVKTFNITAQVKLTSVGVQSLVDAAIRTNFAKTWKIAQSLPLSQLYKLCHTDGVREVAFSGLASSDVACLDSEVLKTGTITLTYTT